VTVDLSVLNPSQKEAVLHGDGPLLILAGAGSGKTRVITYRISHLVLERQVAPWKILAVTFTNKAAGEMKERLEKMLGPQAAELHVATFHATGAAILRREAEAIGLTRSFVIYDDSDQLALIKRAMRAARLDERQVPPKAIAARLDEAKNEGKPPDKLWAKDGDEVHAAAVAVYPIYEQMLQQANAVDFGDLIVKPLELFRTRRDILDKYQRRFRYVLVDEFQDTNPAQFGLVQKLCPPGANLCVVGDDDQAIYRWRGADVDNILSFDTQYPTCKVVKLEQNYRSDANILEAAYAVISKNTRRKAKKLVTDHEKGMPLSLFAARDERGEAQQVSTGIKQLLAGGVAPSEIAVFYRTNAQSRVLEESLRLARVPYAIVRGRSFYDRAEVKDALSYLRVALNPKSDADFLRVINTPPRGIGDTTVERITDYASQRKLSVFEAIGSVDFVPDLNSGARKRLQQFRKDVEAMQLEVVGHKASEAMQAILDRSGLIQELELEDTEEAQARIENLRELVHAAQEFDEQSAKAPPLPPEPPAPAVPPAPATASATPASSEGNAVPPESAPNVDDIVGPLAIPPEPLAAFLEATALLGEADVTEGIGRVSMMTLHAAKGLEFDCVFMTGMEESVFPHNRAIGDGADPEELAEERRLCYVGITRARKRLFLSLATSRALFGELKFNRPSRFLAEIPRELFAFGPESQLGLRTVMPPSQPVAPVAPKGERVIYDDEFVPEHGYGLPGASSKVRRQSGPAVEELGQRVVHDAFGEGEVRERDGSGPDAKVVVFFPSVGLKKVIARFLRPA
jgi:DNA helicase-2/ATP-dependent DNA helicase PcrA